MRSVVLIVAAPSKWVSGRQPDRGTGGDPEQRRC